MGHLRVRASLGIWGSDLRPEDRLSPLRALSPCQEPACSPELLVGREGVWLALILALTTAVLWTDAKKCLALALAEHMSGLGGQRGAALMPCYEMVKGMRARPGPLKAAIYHVCPALGPGCLSNS